jgi:hypothetical protein
MQHVSIILAIIALTVSPTHLPATDRSGHIVLGPNASAMEQYAARELQRYLYQVSGTFLAIETAKPDGKPSGLVFLLGTRESNPLIAKLAEEGLVQISTTELGPQGYMLNRDRGEACASSPLTPPGVPARHRAIPSGKRFAKQDRRLRGQSGRLP